MCVIWGTTYLAIRVALETVPPALVGAFRYTFAGGVLLLFLWLSGHALPGARRWFGLAVTGLLMIVLGNGGVIWAEQWVPSGIAAVTVASTPFWMIGVEAVLPGGARLAVRSVIGLLVGFLGVVMLVWPDLVGDGASRRQFALGMVALQVACLGWALGSAYSRREDRSDNAMSAAGGSNVDGRRHDAHHRHGAWRME